MFNYLIKANFRSGKAINFTAYAQEIQEAVDAFNDSAEERGKGSKLKLHNVTATYFEVILRSPSVLAHPSKSLVKFSQALSNKTPIRQYIVNGNQLISCIKISLLPASTLTDGQLLTSIINLIHNNDCCTNSTELSARRKLIDDIKKLIQDRGL